MAITLKRLLNYVADEKLTILSGEKNLNRAVRWVHMVESIEISIFLEGQEVAFLTGAALRSNDDLMEVVKSVIENQATALVINIGPYIKEIPEYIINYCKERQFPLISTPWEVHMAHIMQVFCRKITEEDKANMELSSAVKNAIFFPKQEELYVPALERYQYSLEWSYCVAMIEIVKGVMPMEKERRRKIATYIENQLTHSQKTVIVFEIEEKILLVFHQTTEKEIKKILERVMINYCCMMHKEENSYIGIGQCTKNMKCIAKSYNQANGVLKLQKSRNQGQEVQRYSELGLYKLLLAMDDVELEKEYYMETLGVLIRNDEANDSNYCQILECYLKHSGSVKDTAEELFVHRNTINTKINKIEELTGMDLSLLDTRVKFKIVFLIQEIL
ncbi:MAG: PucR family transcriptional regulator ligand-binding domain-containing protein [Anaerostipes sp.]|nr:PucR family transcriptional regulator ligand-binding domain-containing protein [Anaerostipes sp.]